LIRALFLLKKWAERIALLTALLNETPGKGFSRSGAMVVFFPVILKRLFRLGRNYPWPKPDSCPRCSSCRLWGHGYVSACFDGYDQSFTLKRYRCPDCGCVIRLRPRGYFKRFQASVATIRSSVIFKAFENRWIGGVGRTRQRHWFNALRRKIKAHLTDAWSQGLVAGFDHLLQMGQIPVSRAI
jgi:hypothetical protein